MTDLIPRDAAIGAIERWWMCSQTTWQSPMTILRAIPTIDPAAIREAALREAAAEIKLWWASVDDAREPDELIITMIGEKK